MLALGQAAPVRKQVFLQPKIFLPARIQPQHKYHNELEDLADVESLDSDLKLRDEFLDSVLGVLNSNEDKYDRFKKIYRILLGFITQIGENSPQDKRFTSGLKDLVSKFIGGYTDEEIRDALNG